MQAILLHRRSLALLQPTQATIWEKKSDTGGLNHQYKPRVLPFVEPVPNIEQKMSYLSATRLVVGSPSGFWVYEITSTETVPYLGSRVGLPLQGNQRIEPLQQYLVCWPHGGDANAR